MDQPKKRGRKPLLPEVREANAKASAKASKAKFKNVTIDADLVDLLNVKCDDLEKTFGFRPTISQALRYLIKHA